MERERGSGISVLAARHDDDDEKVYWWKLEIDFNCKFSHDNTNTIGGIIKGFYLRTLHMYSPMTTLIV